MNFIQGKLFARRYFLEQLIGTGGSGEIWLAKDRKAQNKLLALKIFHQASLSKDDMDLFSHEFSLVYDLNHLNLLIPSHFDEYKRVPYLVMPYMKNGSCGKYTGSFSGQEAIHFLSDIGSALEYLHNGDPQIIHRDIKPSNILIDDRGNYRLADFGVSSGLKEILSKGAVEGQEENVSDEIRKADDIVGTHPYRPPEWFRNPFPDKMPSPEKDIFSLGLTVYEMITGDLPFVMIPTGVAILNGEVMPELPETIPLFLKDLIFDCLSLDPTNRPSAGDLVHRIKTLHDKERVEGRDVIQNRNQRDTIEQEKSKERYTVGKLSTDSGNQEQEPLEKPPINDPNPNGRRKFRYFRWILILVVLLVIVLLFMLLWPKKPGIYLKQDLKAGILLEQNSLEFIPLKNPEKKESIPYDSSEICGKCLSCDTAEKIFRKGHRLTWKDIGSCAGLYLVKGCPSGTEISDSIIRSVKPASGSKIDDRPINYSKDLKNKGFRLECGSISEYFHEGTVLTWNILEKRRGAYLKVPVRPGTQLEKFMVDSIPPMKGCSFDEDPYFQKNYPTGFYDLYKEYFTGSPGCRSDTIYPEGTLLLYENTSR